MKYVNLEDGSVTPWPPIGQPHQSYSEDQWAAAMAHGESIRNQKMQAQRDSYNKSQSENDYNNKINRNNELLNEQNRLFEEQNFRNEQILQEMQEQNRIMAENAEKAEREAYKATAPERSAQLGKLYDEVSKYAQKNNMVRVYICLPKNIIARHHRLYGIEYGIRIFDLLYMLENYSLKYFFSRYNAEDRFVDASSFGREYTIEIPKGGIKKIKQSKKIQDYYSDNKNNDMFAFKYKNGYVIISPDKIAGLLDEGNEDKIIIVDRAPYVVWLREDELLSFLRSYNGIIKKEMIDIFEKAKKQDRNEIIYKIKNIVKSIYPFIIIGIVILVLMQMCK